MGYELRAVVGKRDLAERFAETVSGEVVGLNQGLALVPITDQVFDGLGGGEQRSYGETFWFLSQALVNYLASCSLHGPLAYIEVELFGGTGTQAAVVWAGGSITDAPVLTEFQWPPTATHRQRSWAVNGALRELGVDVGSAVDEFDAVGLSRGPRATAEWVT